MAQKRLSEGLKKKFWRVLPWGLLGLLVAVLAWREFGNWAIRQNAVRRFYAGKAAKGLVDRYSDIDYRRCGRRYGVYSFKMQRFDGRRTDDLAVVVNGEYVVLVSALGNGHRLESVSVNRGEEGLFGGHRHGETEGEFPTGFWVVPLTGPDAGYTLSDDDFDGVFDYKFGDLLGKPFKVFNRGEDGNWIQTLPEPGAAEADDSAQQG